jgi:glycerophosphoryl diester phosphodiesterase
MLSITNKIGVIITSAAAFNKAGLALLLGVVWALSGCSTTPQFKFPAFDTQGHRGARGHAPENTLPAFAKALELGVTTLELDTLITRDGVVVIGHDPLLNPDIARRDGQWLLAKDLAVQSLTLAQLQQIDVGRIKPDSAYAKRYPTQQAIDGTRMPTLAALFAQVKQTGNPHVNFNIEIKSSPLAPDITPAPDVFAAALIKAIRDAGMQHRSLIQSFDWRALQAAQRIAPGIPTVYLSAQQSWFDNIGAGKPEGSPWTAGFNAAQHPSVPHRVKAAGGAVWSPHFADLTPELLRTAHSLGLKVVVWTVNEPEAIARMRAMGVDGIISDWPDRVR